MKRFWINFATSTAFVGAAAFIGPASARDGGGGSGFRGPVSHAARGPNLGSQIKPVRQVVNKAPFNGGLNGGIKPITPKFPGGPIGPVKPPFVGPIKPPVVGPIKPPVVGPIGPIKPPVVGPIKPPFGPIKPPFGPIKPPKGPIVGPIGPIGPVKPPVGGGGSGPICPPIVGNHHHHCKPWWPPVVLGCTPCVGGGGYYGGYYPVVNNPFVVPVATTTVVDEQVAVVEQTVVTPAVATTSTEKLPEVPVGSTVTLNAKELGPTGQALLVIDKVTLGIHVDEWAADHATATLPSLMITSPTPAEIVLVKADGFAANTVKVQLVPAPQATSETLATMASLTR